MTTLKEIKGTEDINRNYKDSMFRMIFRTPEKMIELYNAIFDTDYPPDTPIDINTIEEVFHRVQKNDISFTIDGTYIMVSEHQSTINPNMPLRDIFYIVEIWRGMVESSQLYKRRIVKVPQPKFIVLYTGREPIPPVSRLELSDSFLGDNNKPLLNLTVLVYNVNEGINCDILKKSPTLYQYSQLVALIRKYQARGPVTSQDMSEITHICLEKGILVDFMKEHGNSIRDLLHYEITYEEDIKLTGQEYFEEGLEKGAEKMAERLNKLNELLLEKNRLDDLRRTLKDADFQKQLLEEFGI